MKCLLSLSTRDVDPNSYPTVGPEIFLSRLKDSLPQYLSVTDSDLEQYLTVLTEDGVRGDTGGGVIFGPIFKKLAILDATKEFCALKV